MFEVSCMDYYKKVKLQIFTNRYLLSRNDYNTPQDFQNKRLLRFYKKKTALSIGMQ